MNLSRIPAAIILLATLAGCAANNSGKTMAGTNAADKSVKADQLILGNIITVNEYKPVAEAMTVKDGLIQFVGSEDVARAMCDESTEVLDYGDNFVYPGFLEAHAHGAGAGIRLAGQADLTSGTCVEDYLETMKAWMESHPDKEVFCGSGWKGWLIENPVKETLDAICPDKPMVLTSLDGHSVWVNSALLKQQNIDKAYAEKMGPAQVHVDAEGNPTGMISEGAAAPLLKIDKITHEDLRNYILAWQDFAFAKGYTAASEAGTEMAGEDAKKAYSELGAEGKLKFRTYAYHLVADDSTDPEADVAAALEDIRLLNNEYFKVIGMKIFIDGVIEARTGWTLADYADQPGYNGLQRYANHDVAVRLLEESSRNGLSVHAHTIGDGAVRFMLDAIEEAAKETGDFDQRNILVHLQLVAPEDFKKFADYGVIAGTAPLWVPKSSAFQQEVDYVGLEAAERGYPIGSFIDAGVVNVSHTDYPVSTEISIPLTFYRGVLRHSPGNPANQRNAAECISREDVLKSMTINVAYLWKEEDRLGSLEVGKIANATVFDKNFLEDDMEDVAKARLIATVVDGKQVYSAE